MKKLITTTFLLLLSVSNALAHSGRTDSSGCHNCYTGSCAGEYHCHNGGYGGYTGGYIAPSIPENPIGNGTWEFTPHLDEPLYDIYIDWSDTPLNNYSITISKTAGGDPGPLIDTNQSSYTFRDVKPGRWFVNIKANVGGTWSKVAYWTVDVPQWVKPTPTPTPYPTRIPTQTQSNNSNSEDAWTWIVLLSGGMIWGGYYLIKNWYGSRK